MEDPTTPSSRDPPTAPSSPVVSSYPGVPFASFERASAHVQGRFHDAYAFAKRFGDQPLRAHTLTGHLPASARSSEVVSAALKSLGAKTRSVEQDRDAWRAKYEDAQRELFKVAAERDEEAAKRAEDSSARRHRSRAAISQVASPPNASPSPQTVRARVRRIEGLTDVVRSGSVTTCEPDRSEDDDGDARAFPNGREVSVGDARETTTTAEPSEPAKQTKKNDASLVLGFTRADLEAATRRAETAEAALRASEAAHASDTIRATAHSEIGMLKTQLAAARAEHVARLRELDASWSARLRLAEENAEKKKNRAPSASAASGEISTRREAKDALEEADDATDKNTREARLAARVRELESVVAALTSTMSRAPRRVKRLFGAFRAKPRRKKNNHNIPNPRASSSSLRGDSYSSDEWESDASDSDSDAREFGSVSEPARRLRGRAPDTRSGRAKAPARRGGKKPWGSGFATSRADGALGLSPSRTHRENVFDGESSRGEPKTGRMDEPRRTATANAKKIFFSRPPPRPPFRGAAKRATAAPTPTAVARAAGGFSYPGDGAEERQRQRHASREAEARRKRFASVSGGIGAAERRSDSSDVLRGDGEIREGRAKGPPAPEASNVSDVSGVSRARSMEALKRARAAAKRRVATVAAARSGSITASPAASLAPSPAASPARPVRRGDDGDASLAALRAEFEATREEYSRLALGVLGSDSGAALDDVIERLQEVSAAIAKRVRATA